MTSLLKIVEYCDTLLNVGDYQDYAETFLTPFARSLDQLGVRLEIVRSEERYRAGCFTEKIALALENREHIANIIEEESGRRLEEDWAPVTVLYMTDVKGKIEPCG